MDGTAQTHDDGAYDHLRIGMEIPHIELPSTTGVDLDIIAATSFTVLFLYPMTGVPGEPLPEGWMDIPGAFGCTAQSCGYRDLAETYFELDAAVQGVSTQTTSEQEEFAVREGINYPLLSDSDVLLTKALALPVLDIPGEPPRIKRATLIVDRNRTLRSVIYPVPDPGANAQEALSTLRRLVTT
jgi:peroxiredoxin